MSNEIEIVDAGSLRHYRTEIPNIVFELGLTPYELALYLVLRRTAGGAVNSVCWKATGTLAKETGMSVGMIAKTKAGLLTKRPALGGKALIILTKQDSGAGRARDVITLTDIWPENFAFFGARSKQKATSQGEKQSSPCEVQSSYSEVQSSYSEVQSSPGEIKKEPYKERTLKEETTTARNDFTVASKNPDVLSAVLKALKKDRDWHMGRIGSKDKIRVHQIVELVLELGHTAADVHAYREKDFPAYVNKTAATAVTPSPQQMLSNYALVKERAAKKPAAAPSWDELEKIAAQFG